jgi:hypothetical protein
MGAKRRLMSACRALLVLARETATISSEFAGEGGRASRILTSIIDSASAGLRGKTADVLVAACHIVGDIARRGSEELALDSSTGVVSQALAGISRCCFRYT